MSTVTGSFVILSVIGLASVMALGAMQLLHHNQAQTAADLGALSAATVLLGGEDEGPCQTASTIVESNGAALDRCEVRGDMVTVEVSVRKQNANATAGPVGVEGSGTPR